MEVRARNNCNGNGSDEGDNNNLTMAELLERANSKSLSEDKSMSKTIPNQGRIRPGGGGGEGILGVARREMFELGRASLRLLKGEGSWLAYLMVPAVTAMLWLLVCMLTTRAPSMSLEQRLSHKYLKVRWLESV